MIDSNWCPGYDARGRAAGCNMILLPLLLLGAHAINTRKPEVSLLWSLYYNQDIIKLKRGEEKYRSQCKRGIVTVGLTTLLNRLPLLRPRQKMIQLWPII